MKSSGHLILLANPLLLEIIKEGCTTRKLSDFKQTWTFTEHPLKPDQLSYKCITE